MVWYTTNLYYMSLSILREIVIGLLEFSIEQEGVYTWKECKGCFSKQQVISKGILYFVHLDVCGLMLVALVQGPLYYATFIYEFQNKSWIFFMNTKGEAFSRFGKFKVQVENQTMTMINVFWLNNGGEYNPNEFKYFYEVRIKKDMTVSYNPQQNQIVERKSHSIIADTQEMIHEKGRLCFLGRCIQYNILCSSQDIQGQES